MKIIRNPFIPFGSYMAVNLFGVLFCKKGIVVDKRLLNHERIHTAQMRELLFLPFYLWYGVEYGIRLLCYLDHGKAYQRISFEREAYRHEGDLAYLERRKWYAWVRYL